MYIYIYIYIHIYTLFWQMIVFSSSSPLRQISPNGCVLDTLSVFDESAFMYV